MAIDVENLNFSYYHQPILKHIHFQIPSRKFTVLLGKNGSGKSTLFRIIAGILNPDSGIIRILGKDAADLSLRERSKMIGFLSQYHRPVFPFLVEDVVLTGRAGYIRLTPKLEDQQKAIFALEQAGISHLRKRRFTELSGGEQQMVRIARVLVQNPEIILLDEPTAHLDMYYQVRVIELIKNLVEFGKTVAAVIHDPNIAFQWADEFIYLKNGEILQIPVDRNPWDIDVLEQVYDTSFVSQPYLNRAWVAPKISRTNV